MSFFAVQPPTAARRSGGFTLVELLVTITIIGILAGVVMGALQAARQVAKKAKTKSLITRLDNVIMQRYESYRTRRVPISTSGDDPIIAAEKRLAALRDLMRMEMPDRWSDVTNGPFQGVLTSRPRIAEHFLRQHANAVTAGHDPLTTIPRYGPAELLYLIVQSSGPDARGTFNDSDAGDIDGDGLREFHDAWGQPIFFLRWAPGFNASDVQANIDPWTNNAAKQQATENDHDPFDPRKTDLIDSSGSSTGWRLVPLIYSGGPDERRGIDAGNGQSYNGNPYATFSVSGADVAIGTPTGDAHFDNIHNHHIEAR